MGSSLGPVLANIFMKFYISKWLNVWYIGRLKFVAIGTLFIKTQKALNLNACPPFLIDKVMKIYLDSKFSSNQNQLKDTSVVYYFKLPYIDNLPHHIKNKLSKLCKEFFKENFNIKLVFNSLKIKSYFSYKDPIPDKF